jgi:hypothetical protein
MTCSNLSEQAPSRGARRVRTSLLAAALALVAAGCDDSTTPPVVDPPQFLGNLVAAEGFEELEGSAVVVPVTATGFEVAMALEGAPATDDGFPWLLREGSCAEPGDALGDWEDFPLIDPDGEGEWNAEVDVPLDAEADGYVIDIRRAEDDLDTVMACAFVEREG